MINFLNVPQWVSESFPIIQTILLILVVLCAIGIILTILIQPSNPDGGNNAITGMSDSYYSQNKGDTKEGRLNRLIVIFGIVILVSTLAYFITMGIYNGLGA